MGRYILTLFLALVFGGGVINEIFANNFIENSLTFSQNNSDNKKRRKVEDDGYVWYELNNENYKEGAMDVNGRIIIPVKYDLVVYHSDEEHEGHGYFGVELNGSEGVYSKNGTCLISTTRGYTNVYKHNGVFRVENGDNKGICDHNGKEIISPKRGYDSITDYSEKGYYQVEKNGSKGVCNIYGKEIIFPGRYDRIYYREEGYYEVQKNGNVGICNLSGQEIVATIYENVLFNNNEFVGIDCSLNIHNLNIDINGKSLDMKTDVRNASTKGLSGTQGASSGLLFEGTYTISNRGYCAELGGYTDPIGVGQVVNVKIYNNYIIVGGERHNHVKTSNGYYIYGNLNNTYYKVNSQTFNMSMHMSMYNQFTGFTNTWTYAMERGEVIFNIQPNNNNYNNSIENGVNQNKSTTIRSSGRSPQKCGACDGKGWIPSTRGVSSFGQDKWCSECRKKVPANHYHETCPSCKGNGTW